jgi:deazaflavin-dependent oxidoreductase (nitroreductase family)
MPRSEIDDPFAAPPPGSKNSSAPAFQRPGIVAASFNRLLGFCVSLGFGPVNAYLLEVRGRKSGRIHSTPVYSMTLDGKEFLVAPRGRTEWVRNAEVAGEISLKRGRARREFRLRAIPDAERPQILKAYLDGFAPSVQRYFPVPAGSPATAFEAIAAYYPAFELIPR